MTSTADRYTIKDAWNNGSNHRVYHAQNNKTKREYLLVNCGIPRLLETNGKEVISAVNNKIIKAILNAREARHLGLYGY